MRENRENSRREKTCQREDGKTSKRVENKYTRLRRNKAEHNTTVSSLTPHFRSYWLAKMRKSEPGEERTSRENSEEVDISPGENLNKTSGMVVSSSVFLSLSSCSVLHCRLPVVVPNPCVR